MGSHTRFEKERTAKDYEAYYETKYKKADVLEKKLITQLFAQFPNAKNVLEVGCGTGHFTGWLKSSIALEAVGVDTSWAMLREAKSFLPQIALAQGEGSRLPFKDKSVDVVFFMTSLEFISDAVGALKEAARVARVGINLGLMNKNSLSTLKKRLKAATLNDSFYKQARFYSLSDIKTIMEKILPEEHEIVFCSTTVFSKPFSSKESSVFPFGGLLGIAVRLEGFDE
ncbi:MAG: class I SAM-dependent methyltransferase [Candidatus Bathyarchaeia archaeon]